MSFTIATATASASTSASTSKLTEKIEKMMKYNVCGPLMGALLIGFAYSGGTTSDSFGFRKFDIYNDISSDGILASLVAGYGNAIVNNTSVRHDGELTSHKLSEIVITTYDNTTIITDSDLS